MGGDGLRLHHARCRLDVREKSFSEGWRCCRTAWEVFPERGDVALRDVAGGHGGGGLGLGPVLSVVFSNLRDSIIQPKEKKQNNNPNLVFFPFVWAHRAAAQEGAAKEEGDERRV